MVRTAGRYLRRTHARSIHLTSGVCVCCLASNGTNYDVQRLTKQPKLTAIIQSRQLTRFGHITRMDDNADTKRILLASHPADWRRQPGHPPHHVAQHHPTESETAPPYAPRSSRFGSEPPSWRMMSTYGATQS